MATTTTTTNKPLNPRAQDLSPKGYNRAALFSGKALSFDGVNDIMTTDGVSATLNSFTISGYVRFDALPVNDAVVLAFASTSASQERFILFNNGSDLNKLYIYSPTLDVASAYSSNYIIKAGEWFHYAITFGTSMTFFINGKQTASYSLTSSTALTNQFIFGARKLSSYQQYFTGLNAGFKAFGVTLTPAQVADLYLNPEKITPDGVATSALKLWLPMMEGAGASAYDGSGNGNDGTINGATWTAGVGAPVAQTALVSWNKGINGAIRSENFGSGDWVKNATAVTDNTIAAPNGTTTADTLENNTTNTTHRFYQMVQAFTGTGALSFSIYLKYKDHRYFSFGLTDDSQYRAQIVVDLLNGTITDNFVDGSTTITSSTLTAVGDGWYKLSATINATGSWLNNLYALGVMLNQSTFTSAGYAGTGTGVYIWGAQANIGTAQPYIKTNATAQTSAVLVPEGLTVGASIFGTDIITPRNAFALNLDGASWAGVHDNASTDLTSAVTLEFWVKTPAVQSGVYGQMIGKRDTADSNWLRFYKSDGGLMVFEGNGGTSLTTTTPNNTWTHFVGTISGTSAVLYKNGVSVNSGTVPFNFSETVPVGLGAWLSSLTQVQSGDSYVVDTQLANPRIYNRALTAAEVLRNYNADKAKFGL